MQRRKGMSRNVKGGEAPDRDDVKTEKTAIRMKVAESDSTVPSAATGPTTPLDPWNASKRL